MRRYLRFSYLAMIAVASLPAYGDITYSCDASIDGTQLGTCAYLNSAVAGLYNNIFSNAGASIYIQQNGGGLGGSETSLTGITYGQYLSGLTSHASTDAVDVAALSALNSIDSGAYGTGNVVVTTALAVALGFDPKLLSGITKNGVSCSDPGSSGCYNGVITLSTPANLPAGQSFYWNQNGGTQGAASYDIYSVVEHETDEILGSASCIDTQTTPLTNDCGSGTAPSAVDLFRYSSPGNLVLDSSLSTTPGAYFSFNGGATNGAAGATYNTLDNGEDYADFATNCAHVQDAEGCLGMDLEINNDGGAEINILDAVGFNQNTVPEPGTISLFALGLAGLVAYRRRGA